MDKRIAQIVYSAIILMAMMIMIPQTSADERGGLVSVDKSWNPFGYEKRIYEPLLTDKIREYPTITIADQIFWVSSGEVSDYKIIKLECGFTSCVMRYGITTYKDIALFDNQIKITDLETNKDIDKKIDYYIRGKDSYETIEVNDYSKEAVCNRDGMCSNEIIGSHNETKTIENWDKYNFDVVPAGYYEIELRGNIQIGKAVDVKAYALGYEFTEHAVWNSSYTDGLVAYYNFTDLNTLNAVNTASNKLTINTTGLGNGIIGAGINMSSGGASDYLENRTIRPAIGATYTYCGWYNITSVDQYDALFAFTNDDGGTNNQVCQFYTASTLNDLHCDAYIGGSANTVTVNIGSLQNKWTFLCSQMNSSTHAVFINGALNASTSVTGSLSGLNILVLGNDRFGFKTRKMNGVIDEVGLWNRTLSTAEILDLYNGGAGLTYSAGGAVDTTLSGRVDLLTPLTGTNTTTSPVSFSANATATNGNVTNMTLTIWNSTTITNFTTRTGVFNVTNWTQSGLVDASYQWNVYACFANSTASLCTYNSTNRTFQLDANGPVIAYGTGTEANNSYLNYAKIYINVTATDGNYNNTIIYIYNSTSSLINTSTGTTSPLVLNATGMNNGTYYFNATSYDTLGNKNSLPTRVVTINTAGAGLIYGTGTTPDGTVKTGTTLTVNVTAASPTDFANATINLYNGSSNLINSTFHTTQPVYLTYTGLTDGTYYINVTGYSTNSNPDNLGTYTWKLDNVAPTVNIVYPINNANYSASTWYGQLNYTASDTNLGSCWYSINGGATNTTVTCGTNVTGLEPYQYSTINNWLVGTNDSAGNSNYTTLQFYALTYSPIFNNYTLNNTYFNSTQINLKMNIQQNTSNRIPTSCIGLPPPCLVTEGSYVYNYIAPKFNISYKINSMTQDAVLNNSRDNVYISSNTNITVFGTSYWNDANRNYNTTNVSLIQLLPDGTYYWNVTVIDAFGNSNMSETRVFTVDTTAPVINISTPSEAIDTLDNGQNLSLNYSISDLNIGSCWFNYNNINTSIPCNNNHSFLYVSGKNNLTVYANDSTGNTGSAYTSWGITLTLINNTYSPTAFETTNEIFSSNVALFPGLNLLSASLIYNGTEYSGASLTLSGTNTYLLSKTINIPLNSNPFATETKNFYWMVLFTNGNRLNTTSLIQNVSPINIVLCNATFDDLALNFTTYDTVTPTIPLNASFESTFSIRSINGTSSLAKNFSYASINENRSNWMFCINSSGTNVTLNAFIDYYASGYDPRSYLIQDGIIGSFTQNIPLYLASTDTTDIVTVTVKDQNYNPLAGALVTIQQWNIGSNSFSTVGMFTTGNQGTGLINLVLYTTWYRAMITIDGVLVEVTDIQKMDDTTWEIIVDLDVTNPYDLFGTITHGLTFNNATNITTFTWSDSSGYTQKGCLIIKNMTSLGYSTISTECTVTTAGTISYLLPPGGDYYMQGVLFLDDSYGVSQVVDELFERLGIPSVLITLSPYGKVISFLLIGTGGLIGAAASSPIWGIGLVVITMFASWKLGWLNLTTGIFTSFFVVLLVAWFRQFRRNN